MVAIVLVDRWLVSTLFSVVTRKISPHLLLNNSSKAYKCFIISV